MLKVLVPAAAMIAAILPAMALAQNLASAPNARTLNLSAGFTPDPTNVSVVAGGDRNASGLGSGCTGFISDAPDVRLNYSGGDLPLIFKVLSNKDTALVINTPDGRWICDDDSNGNLDPKVRFNRPASGQYDIWIANLSAGDLETSTLVVTELD